MSPISGGRICGPALVDMGRDGARKAGSWRDGVRRRSSRGADGVLRGAASW